MGGSQSPWLPEGEMLREEKKSLGREATGEASRAIVLGGKGRTDEQHLGEGE